MVSVLIPTYKPGDYLFKCLSSIEDQTLDKGDFKVYIGFNGPVEHYFLYVKNILKDFTFNYEIFIIDKVGVSNSRNFLLDVSTEDFVVFLDDDDILSPDYLSKLLDVSSNGCLAISDIKNFKDDLSNLSENYIGASFKVMPEITTSKFISRKYFSSPCAKMIPRLSIGNFRFDPKLAKGEDSLFMANISKNIIEIRKASILACYFVNQRSGSVTRSPIILRKELFFLNRLIFKYSFLIFKKDYDRLFILTRIVATILKYFKLLIK